MTQVTGTPETNGLDPKGAQGVDVKAPEVQENSAAVEVKSTPSTFVKIISKNELNEKMQSGEEVQIVNVLDPKYYDMGFIKGSKKIPLDQLSARLSELDKSKEVVTYCASKECSTSKHAVRLLVSKGFSAVAYEGGIKEWKEAGLPTEA